MLAANMENTTMRMRIETSLAVKMTIDFHARPVPDAFRKWLLMLGIDVIGSTVGTGL